jgi:DNA-binding beta-propeller fold protein YncE
MACRIFLAVLSLPFAIGPMACRRGENGRPPGAAPASRSKPRIPENAVVPAPRADVLAQVTLRIGESSGLLGPRGIAIDPSGNIYVADAGNARVVKFDPSGRESKTFGRKGSGPGDFTVVWKPVMTPEGKILVLDRESAWINAFDSDGQTTGRFGGPEMRLYFPGGLAVANDGTIFLADTGLDRVLKLSSEGSILGEPITVIAGIRLRQPTDVAVDSGGALHVYQTAGVDTPSVLLHRPASGAPETVWIAVDAPSTVDSPRMVVASDGRIYLTDPEHRQIVLYAADGKAYWTVRMGGPEARPLQRPGGIAMDREGRVYLADTGANVIYRFEVAASD